MNNRIHIHFQDTASVGLQPTWYRDVSPAQWNDLSTLPILKEYIFLSSAARVYMVRQVHGTRAIVIEEHDYTRQVSDIPQADALITNQPYVALAVLTADCLPIMYYDPVHQAIAAIHAGWRGSIAKIAQITFEHMHRHYGTQARDLQVFLGPCAQVCCYQVDEQFIENLAVDPHRDKVCIKKNDGWFFNNLLYNYLCLKDLGVPDHSVLQSFSQCTIHNHNYWSYRRQKNSSLRNFNSIMLI